MKPEWLLNPSSCPGFLKSEVTSHIEQGEYIHHTEYLLTGEDNADAHLKSYLTNHALTAPITHGELDFGMWQQIFYAEFDGQREKRVLVKITGLKKK